MALVPTYDSILSYTVPSNTTSVTLGSGGTIPQTYTDLVLIINANFYNQDVTCLRFNGYSTSIYACSRLFFDGSNLYFEVDNSATSINLFRSGNGSTTDSLGTIVCNINNYSNTSKSKQVLSRNASLPQRGTTPNMCSGLYNRTDAITSITILSDGSSTITAGTKFALYGIKGGV